MAQHQHQHPSKRKKLKKKVFFWKKKQKLYFNFWPFGTSATSPLPPKWGNVIGELAAASLGLRIPNRLANKIWPNIRNIPVAPDVKHQIFATYAGHLQISFHWSSANHKYSWFCANILNYLVRTDQICNNYHFAAADALCSLSKWQTIAGCKLARFSNWVDWGNMTKCKPVGCLFYQHHSNFYCGLFMAAKVVSL